ncbi:MAG: hypothetical protein OXC63_09035 [Aestuariivita sp.]|nr:hypothetical protein [Aestuariivita sp.]MCY4347837.1 hypothetical protein [Aestuariivita sp.]
MSGSFDRLESAAEGPHAAAAAPKLTVFDLPLGAGEELGLGSFGAVVTAGGGRLARALSIPTGLMRDVCGNGAVCSHWLSGFELAVDWRNPWPKPKTAAEKGRRSAHDRGFQKSQQALIEAATAVAAKEDHVWQQCRRVFNSLFIMLFVLWLVARPNRVSYQTVLAAMWEQGRDDGLPLPNASGNPHPSCP